MRSLTLLRHAKSGYGDRGQRDFDRALNERGRGAARAIGAFMAREDMRFDRVIASPAVRVRETIAAVEAGLGRPLEPVWVQGVYMASAATLIDQVQALPDAAAHVLMIGHNPGLEELALLLAHDGDPVRATVLEKYPTAALAEIALDVDAWAEAREGTGRLVRFTRPRDLDAGLGADED